ncbi:MAG: methionine--tRNA ligase subunit beta, partial [bacterium]
LCVLLHPVMPASTEKIYAQLGLGKGAGNLSKLNPIELKWGALPPGISIGEVEPLFPRLDKGKIMAEIKGDTDGSRSVSTPRGSGGASGAHATEADAVPGASANAETKPPAPQHHATEADAVPASASTEGGSSPTVREGVSVSDGIIEITDFSKVDLRVGEVLTAERIPKADKLLLLTVDIGEEKPRQILAGIAQYYEPEKLIGRKIAVVSNLKPRKLRGYESQGMLLAASVGEEGKPVIATFTEDVPNGARLK